MNDCSADLIAEVNLTITAIPETVYRCFTESSRFSQWMHSGSTTSDRVGGALRVVYPNGIVALGEMLALSAGRQVAFTWGYEHGANGLPAGSTRVEVTLSDVPDGTRLKLVHSGFRNEELRSGHGSGWAHYTALLATAAANEQHPPELVARAVDTYLAAWNETDVQRREKLLATCWAADGCYFDRFASLSGREALNAHIANVQKYMPGLKIERVGPAQHSHGRVVFRWRVPNPPGDKGMSGTDAIRLTLDCRIRELVGFWDAA